ncbi:MAG TPA: phosphate acyltransferase PlsX [Terriglobales bacterium]|nr:phosphate acyltransferase PlsX [Terriglobales bacterium]
MPTIAVDAMGGDHAPHEIVQAAAEISRETDIQCVLVGDPAVIQDRLNRLSYDPARLAVEPALEAIAMAEEPHAAIRQKRHSSILVATQLVAEGRADAVVTAGNTGAAVLACVESFPLIPGVRRSALASVYPRHTEYPGQDQLAMLLDVGATTRCDATQLVHFAIMGHGYAQRVSKIAKPKVALLNMGSEAGKGGEVLVEAHRRLEAVPEMSFIGNIEGHDLVRGKADVIVCEGLLGNVVLKLLEGLAEVVVDLAGAARRENWRDKLGFMMLANSLGRLREMTDYARYGGAPILGFEKLMIKCHGRSTAAAVKNGIKVAAKAVRDDVAGAIAAAIPRV